MSDARERVLSVLLGRRGLAEGVVDVLADLSAIGLVGPFLWLDDADLAEMPRLGGTLLGPGWLVEAGGRQRLDRVDEWLSGLPGDEAPTRCVVGALSVIADGDGALTVPREAANTLALRLAGTLAPGSPAGVVATRHIIVADRKSVEASPFADADAVEWGGWANLLVEPVDAQGPGVSSSEWEPPRDSAELGARAVAPVASLLGLWTGAEPAEVPTGQGLHLVRSFHRRIDATVLEGVLRDRVLNTEAGLPLPTPTVRGEEFQPQRDAGDKFVERLFRQYRDIFEDRPLEDLPGGGRPEPVALGERIKVFWRFLLATLRDCPHHARAQARATVFGTLARVAQVALEGPHPSRLVSVAGYLADGTPVAWWRRAEQVAAQAESLQGELEGIDPRAPDDLWRDLEAGLLTLADGQTRSALARPPGDGSRLGVLPDAAAIVPPPEAEFVLPPPWSDRPDQGGLGIVAIPPGSSLLAHDVVGWLRNRADWPANPPPGVDPGPGPGPLADAIEAWDLSQEASVAGRIGRRLRDRFLALEYALTHPECPLDVDVADLERLARRSAAVIRWLSLVAAVGLVVVLMTTRAISPSLAVPVPWPLVETWRGGALCAGVVAFWLLVTFVVFSRFQSAFFAAVAQRRWLDAAAAVLRRRQAERMRHYLMVADAAERLTCWVTVWGELLARPFGHPPPRAGSTLATGIENLPLTVMVGSATVDDQAVANAVPDLRRHVFKAGWLNEPATELHGATYAYTRATRADAWAGPGHDEPTVRVGRSLAAPTAARDWAGGSAVALTNARDWAGGSVAARTDDRDAMGRSLAAPTAGGDWVELTRSGRLVPADRYLTDREDGFYGLNRTEQAEALPRWAGTVRRRGLPLVAGQRLWESCFVSPDARRDDRAPAPPLAPGQPVRQEVLTHVQVGEAVRRSRAGVMTVANFLLGLEPGREITVAQANESLIAATKRGHVSFRPAQVVAHEEGLSVEVTLTQMTQSLARNEIVVTEEMVQLEKSWLDDSTLPGDAGNSPDGLAPSVAF